MAVGYAEEKVDAAVGREPERSRRPSPLFWLVIAAVLARLCLVVVAHGFSFVDMPVRDDSSLFNETTNIAASIAAGHGFTSPMMALT